MGTTPSPLKIGRRTQGNGAANPAERVIGVLFKKEKSFVFTVPLDR